MATINGQFDIAMLLLERGADPNLAARVNGATPLWAAINTQWQPRTRFPQPQEMELQKATYLDVMSKRCSRRAPIRTPGSASIPGTWSTAAAATGTAAWPTPPGSTAFWRAAYSTDVEAMRLLVKYGADPNIPTMAPQQAGPPRPPRAAAPAADGRSTKPRCHRRRARRCCRRFPTAGRARRRCTPRPASSTAKASPATPTATRRTAGCRR